MMALVHSSGVFRHAQLVCCYCLVVSATYHSLKKRGSMNQTGISADRREDQEHIADLSSGCCALTKTYTGSQWQGISGAAHKLSGAWSRLGSTCHLRTQGRVGCTMRLHLCTCGKGTWWASRLSWSPPSFISSRRECLSFYSMSLKDPLHYKEGMCVLSVGQTGRC